MLNTILFWFDLSTFRNYFNCREKLYLNLVNRIISRCMGISCRYPHFQWWISAPNGIPFAAQNQSENGEYNLILVWFNKIQKNILWMNTKEIFYPNARLVAALVISILVNWQTFPWMFFAKAISVKKFFLKRCQLTRMPVTSPNVSLRKNYFWCTDFARTMETKKIII